MKGTRIDATKEGYVPKLELGDFGKDTDGQWWARTPNGDTGVLDDHQVTEHEDGTISVSPSIVGPNYHGYLERGEWRDC